MTRRHHEAAIQTSFREASGFRLHFRAIGRFLCTIAAFAFPSIALGQAATLSTPTRTLDPAGGRITFSAEINYGGVYGFELEVLVPRGWEYVSGTGEPTGRPVVGAQVNLRWMDHSDRAAPGRFSFTLQYPAGVASASIVPVLSLTTPLDYPTHVGTNPWRIVSRTEGTPFHFGPPRAPVIVYPPVNRQVGEGASATLHVAAEGTPPLRYQWRKDGVPLPDGTAAAYYYPLGVKRADAGTYDVVISNALGSITSRPATLTVKEDPNGFPAPPIINSHPQDTIAPEGGFAVFSVVALRDSYYQWRHDGIDVPGATGHSLVLPSTRAADAGSYSVTVSNSFFATTSRTATLTVNPPPAAGEPPRITLQPQDRFTVDSDAGELTVAATGAPPLRYQWFHNGVPIPGATASTADLSRVMGAPFSGNFSVVVSNAIGATRSRTAVVRFQNTYLGVSTQPLFSTARTVVGGTATFTAPTIGTPPFSYQWFRNDVPIPGATNATLTLSSVVPADAGPYRAVVTSYYGSTPVGGILTIESSPVPASVVVLPANRAVTLETELGLTAFIDGTAPFRLQWLKDGKEIPGATDRQFVIPAVTFADAGAYSLRAENSAGSYTSNATQVRVDPPFGSFTYTGPSGMPGLAAQPTNVTAREGSPALFRVEARSGLPMHYQWRRDGVAIPGATDAAFSLARVTTNDAGYYSVVVWNARGAATSEAARLAVSGPNPRGTYAGTLGSGGSFVLHVRDDGTAAFLGYAAGTGIIARTVLIDPQNHFRFTATSVPHWRIEGAIQGDGTVTGTIAGLDATLRATRVTEAGPTQEMRGFFETFTPDGQNVASVIVSPAGEIFMLTDKLGAHDWAKGNIDASGAFEVTTLGGTNVRGTLQPQTGRLTASLRSNGTEPVSLNGGREMRNGRERMANVSTRAVTVNDARVLTAGFVIAGTQPLPVLIRAVGPTLGQFGVGNTLANARLEVFRNTTSVTTNADWSTSLDAPRVTTAAQHVGAFALPVGSKDAATLLSLTPGDYTATVTGGNGVALVEVYDASEGSNGAARLVNLATRAQAGSGNDALAAGFVVAGPEPKRVLIRGIGPGLAQFGVAGTLTDPKLQLFSGSTPRATNDNWSENDGAVDLAVVAAHVGAFPLAAGSKDAALLVDLEPSPYTVHVTGEGGTSGVALVEIYEVP